MSRRRTKPLTATDGPLPHQRVCEAPGCRLQGEFRAPRARDRLDEYRWFCLEHVRDYNKKWDYFAGLAADQIEAHIRADTTWRRPVWPLGARRNGNSYAHIKDPLGLADDAGLGERPPPKLDGSEQLTPAERNAAFIELGHTAVSGSRWRMPCSGTLASNSSTCSRGWARATCSTPCQRLATTPSW